MAQRWLLVTCLHLTFASAHQPKPASISAVHRIKHPVTLYHLASPVPISSCPRVPTPSFGGLRSAASAGSTPSNRPCSIHGRASSPPCQPRRSHGHGQVPPPQPPVTAAQAAAPARLPRRSASPAAAPGALRRAGNQGGGRQDGRGDHREVRPRGRPLEGKHVHHRSLLVYYVYMK
uniref:Uncharacterized protein n=1 Tax=Aegilops tauschii subsp. strangulata TaxID=200361 RepID=A0A453BYD2_AEGTS